MTRPTNNPALDLVFSGDDAHETSKALYLFMEQVKSDATDAAFTLQRKINAIAEAKNNGKNKKCGRPRGTVLPFSSDKSGLGKRPNYHDFSAAIVPGE